MATATMGWRECLAISGDVDCALVRACCLDPHVNFTPDRQVRVLPA